jgi:hypothetical protein
LFTAGGEKLNCGRLTATPAMRLGGEHWGASALPLRPLAAATVVRSGGWWWSELGGNGGRGKRSARVSMKEQT